MDQEHRKKLDHRLTPLQLYKLTPKSNCGRCGYATCLAFATQAVVGQADLKACPDLDPKTLSEVHAKLSAQHASGIGVSRESFEKTLDYLKCELAKRQLDVLAESLKARFEPVDGRPGLRLVYFGEPLCVTADQALTASRGLLDPWESILVYNYVLGGAAEPSGIWVGMESLPNSISKVKSLKAHCEDRLAQAFPKGSPRLTSAMTSWGTVLDLAEEQVDFAIEARVLPNLAIRVLFWSEDEEEGFPPRVKFLFDSRVLQVVDLESLVFASEQITARLLEAASSERR